VADVLLVGAVAVVTNVATTAPLPPWLARLAGDDPAPADGPRVRASGHAQMVTGGSPGTVIGPVHVEHPTGTTYVVTGGAEVAACAGLANHAVRHLEATADLARAIDTGTAVLAGYERVLGPDHPTTKIVRSNLENARQQRDRRG